MSPYENDDASFEDFYPFVSSKKNTSPTNKKKGKPTSRKMFLETYGDFKTYMVATKQGKMPSMVHKKSAGKIILKRDGTRSGA